MAMDYIYFKKKYPMLSNIIGCHFSAEVASEFDYQYLRRPMLVALRNHAPDLPAYDMVRDETKRLFDEGEAKALLEEDRWFVGDFGNEQAAQDFILREIWGIYFPNEPFAKR